MNQARNAPQVILLMITADGEHGGVFFNDAAGAEERGRLGSLDIHLEVSGRMVAKSVVEREALNCQRAGADRGCRSVAAGKRYGAVFGACGGLKQSDAVAARKRGYFPA